MRAWDQFSEFLMISVGTEYRGVSPPQQSRRSGAATPPQTALSNRRGLRSKPKAI